MQERGNTTRIDGTETVRDGGNCVFEKGMGLEDRNPEEICGGERKGVREWLYRPRGGPPRKTGEVRYSTTQFRLFRPVIHLMGEKRTQAE